MALLTATTALADLPYVTGQTITGLQLNNTTDHKGFKFRNTSGTSITITQLGRWVIAGNNQQHTLSIYDTSPTPVQVASVVVNCNGATPGQFLYGTLSTPYVLPVGASCYIVSSETSGGDLWHSNGGTNLITTNIGTIRSARIEGGVAIDGNDNTRSFGPVSFQYSSPLPNWTKAGTTYTTDGSLYSVNSAIQDASAGDTVTIPAGTFTWGDSGTYVLVNKAIKLQGAGRTQTTINIAPTARTYASGTIAILAAATVSGFTINQSGANTTTAFTAGSANGWRITDITYNSAATVGYFVFPTSYGLIDNCTVNTVIGSDEPIFSRGPTNSWQTPHSMGSADAVFIENCIFNGPGYVCDFNSNARGVVRFNVINGPAKVDGHGLASNSPARGVRHMEVYGNTWTSTNTFWNAMELRGGTGMVFNNSITNTVSDQHGRIRLTDYGYTGLWSNFGSTYQTPLNYPVTDQIGVGMDPKSAGSEPMYLWNNRRGASDWAVSTAPIPAAALTLYRTQTGDPTATYTMDELITANRDYFKEVAPFNGSGGVGIGTKAQMLATTPSKTGVAFWVTDEAEWNSNNPGNDGQLYVWNGSSWTLRYTPYVYPHPLASGTPPPAVTAPTSATVSPASADVFEGADISLSVSSDGTAPLSYQWRKNGSNLADGGNISGATSAVLTITGATTGDAAVYSATVSNSAGSVTSNNSTLTINTSSSPPVIQTQPASQTVDSGNSLQLTVTASGTPPLTYQWQKNGSAMSNGGNIGGATSATLSITNATSSDAATYNVVVTNASGSATSNNAVVTVNTPALTAPTILIHPGNVSTTVGANVVLTAAADGSAPLIYQWRANGINVVDGGAVSGANTPTLTLSNVTTAFTGEYTLVVTNAAGSISSNVAQVVVVVPPPANVAPSFIVHPQDTVAATGETLVLFGQATALPAATYQWQKDGVNVTDTAFRTGATSQTLTITNSQATDAGTYRLVATNALGSATSNGANVAVRDNFAPVVVTQPVDQTAGSGSAVFFTIKVAGFPNPSYQWRKNGANLANGGNILGVDRATLSISNITSAELGTYSVVVKNGLGSITSNDAKLMLNGAPVFTSQPASSQVVNNGAIVQLAVTVAGDPLPTLQWRKNGANLTNGGIISGATTNTLTLTGVSATDAGTYSVVATNSHGSVTSGNFEISVQGSNVWNQPVTTGKDVAISAPDATGNIQWQISTNSGASWTNLAADSTYSGVTTNTLHIANVSADLNTALYRLVTVVNGETTVLHSARLNVATAFVPFPVSVAADGLGNLYVADASNDTVEKINVSSHITTLAGTAGQTGTADGTGTAARFNEPSGVAAASDGTLAVADKANATIRVITTTGVVSTLAGSTTLRGNVDGTGGAATFSSPNSVTRDSAGNLYVADSMNHTIRKVTPGGVVTTLAGAAGLAGTSDGTGNAARFNNPTGIEVDPAGNLFVADTGNNLIRKVTPTGVVTTVAGLGGVTGTTDGAGDLALFNQPSGVAVDNSGNVYVADTGSSTIRRVSSAGVVITVAGLPGIAGHKDGSGIEAWFNQPRDVAVSSNGFLYVADTGNASIRRIDQTGAVTTVALATPPVTNPNPTNPLPPPPTLPTTPTLPTLPTSPTPPSSGGGGGGGGGAPSLWFCATLAVLALLRRRHA